MVVAIVSAAVFAVPFAYIVWRALTLGGVFDAIADSSTAQGLWRSTQLAVMVTVLTAVIGVGLAWLVERTDLPGRRVWGVVAVLPLVIPSFIGAHAYVSAFARGGLLEQAFGWTDLPEVRGLPGAVFVLTALSYPYVYLPVAARLSTLPPSLEEGARMLGRSPWSVFRSIVVPQVAPSMISGALLVTLYCYGEWGAVNFVQYDTLSRRIFEARLDPTRSIAFSLVLGLVAIAVSTGERMARSAVPAAAMVSNRRAHRYRLGRLRVVAAAVPALVAAFALVVPVGVLTWWVVRGRRSGGRRSNAVDLPDATWSSAWIAVVAAAVAVAVVLPLAWSLARRRSRAGTASSIVVTAAFALPGVVIALAMVRMFVGTPAYQTFGVLIGAYVLHFGGQALGVTQSTVADVPSRLDEAARLLGAGRVRRLLQVHLRLMAPGLAAAGGLVLLSVLKELPATLMLRPIGFNTLATRINGSANEALLIDAGQLSLVLVAMSAVLTWALVLRRR